MRFWAAFTLFLLGAGIALPFAHSASRKATAETMFERATLAPMIEKVMPAIVSIRVKGMQAVEQSPVYNNPLFGQTMTADKVEQRPFQSNGSGVIVDPARGLVLTNFHVIEKAKEIKVVLQDGREFDGKLLGKDAAIDVAALKIEADKTTTIPIGDSSKVRVGDFIVALGNPFGLDATATMGMVSSLRRTTVGYRNFESYIQHDAAVNSGNSGGALVNMQGQLIGINTAILSPSGGNIGLGFAIPIKMALQVMEQLVKYGHVKRGWAGLKTTDLTLEKITALDLAIYKGALVTSMQKGSPAEQAGAKIDDVVVGVTLPDGRSFAIASAGELRAGEAVAEVGTKIILKIIRQGQPLDLPVTITDSAREAERAEVPASIVRLAGLVVGSLEADSPLFGEVRGVQVLEVRQGTLAQLVGLLPGDIITQVGADRVRSIEDFLRVIKDKNAKFEMKILRNEVPVLVVFPI
jgi:Do/DeqQ family serine protease